MICSKDELLERKEGENYSDYFERLHEWFSKNILNKLTINGLPLMVREFPPEGMKYEEAFYHLTCTDYEKQTKYRYPDFHRSKRLPLLKAIVKNYDNCPTCIDLNICGGILIWKKLNEKNNYFRYHLFFPEDDYLIVIEKRKKYYLLITGFYVKPLKKEEYFNEYDLYKVDTIS